MDLNDVTSEELLNELFKRFDCSVFSGIIVRSQTEVVLHREYRGNMHTCAGLGLDIATTAIEDFRKKSKKGGSL